MSLSITSSTITWNNGGGSSITENVDLILTSDDRVVISGATLVCKGSQYINRSKWSSFINTGHGTNFNYVNHNTSGAFSYGGDIADTTYSLVTHERILCGGELNVHSDERIKQNIREIPKELAYHTIRNLVPVSYHYKDIVKKGGNLNYGFIAQEVDPIVPFVVKKTIDFIPNIYEVATISDNKITLNQFSTKDLLHRDSGMKIKIFDHKDKEYIVSLEEIIDDKTFRIQEEMMSHFPDNKIFVYGQEVDDLHTLEKNGLFSLTTAAVKYLDADLQETKSMVEKQQGEIDSLKSELQTLKDLWMSRPNIGGGGKVGRMVGMPPSPRGGGRAYHVGHLHTCARLIRGM